MTSLPFRYVRDNELFNRVVRLAAKRGNTRFELFRVHQNAKTLILYRDLPPTRGMKAVVSHDFDTGMTIIDGDEYITEALGLLRKLQVLDDLSDV